MTIITLPCRFAMAAIFTLGNTANVTEGTYIKGICMREQPGNISPWCRRYVVAVFTDIRCIGMIAWFTRCDTAIMTTQTGTYDLAMIQWCN